MPPTTSAPRLPASRLTGRLVVADLPVCAFEEAVGVLARGMRDNPIHVAAFGPDPDRRERCQTRLMRCLFAHNAHNRPIGAWRDGALVGVAGLLVDGGCHPNAGEALRRLPALAAMGPRTASRMTSWLGVWHAHEPGEPHGHLGPVAVDRPLQGHGIGTLLLAEHCHRLDEAGMLGWLETDKPENVPFYERGGYRVVAEADTLGVPCWFMRREPGAGRLR
jgi:GNAT superfamily N-acetyltransferase